MRLPSTCTPAGSGLIRRPISVTTSPSTITRPAAISSSAARRDATPAWASTFWSRTPSGVGSDIVDRVHFWQEGGDWRQILQRGQSKALKEQFGGPVEDATGFAVGAGLSDQTTCHQGTDDAVDIHTTYRSDAGPGHGLSIRDHSER